MAIYRSKTQLTAIAPEALVVYCSAARYQQHLKEFITEGLKLENYSLIAVPGGVQVLTLVDYLPKFAWAGWRWAKFLLEADQPPRLILIGHEDCRWYKHLFWISGRSAYERITCDLRSVRQRLEGRFLKVRVELYYARIDSEGHVVFEPV